MNKVQVETSFQIFINGEPEPVRIVDMDIGLKWDEKKIKNEIALAVYPAIKELQKEVVSTVERVKLTK